MTKETPEIVEVKELDLATVITHLNSAEKGQSVAASVAMIECFKNFEKFPPSSITDKILSVSLTDWHRTLRHHPGYKPRDTLHSLVRLKKLVVQTVVEMHQHYDAFQERERANEEADHQERERVSDLVLKEMITFTALGSALVSAARRHKSSRPEVAEAIDAAMQKFFAPQTSHFIKCLRNNHQHIRSHPTHWEITKQFGPPRTITAKFFLFTEELLQTGDDWDVEALAFLESSEKLDPYDVAAEYARSAVALVDEIEQLNKANPSLAIEHLNAVERIRDGWGARQLLKVMLQPFKGRSDFDPYSYLPTRFSEDELRIIKSLPNHSKAQVDLMILIKDKWGMCDDELRISLYRFFGVSID